MIPGQSKSPASAATLRDPVIEESTTDESLTFDARSVNSETRPGWQLVNGEPRVQDLVLAQWLEFKELRAVRKIIMRWIAAKAISPSCRDTVSRQLVNGGGTREFTVTEYWLTEAEALFVAVKSETVKAIAVTKRIISEFVAARTLSVRPPDPTTELVDPVAWQRWLAQASGVANVTRELNLAFALCGLYPREPRTESWRQSLIDVLARLSILARVCCGDLRRSQYAPTTHHDIAVMVLLEIADLIRVATQWLNPAQFAGKAAS